MLCSHYAAVIRDWQRAPDLQLPLTSCLCAGTQVQIRTVPLHMQRHRCRSVCAHCIYGDTGADPYCAIAYAETQMQIRTAPLHMQRHRCRSVLRHCICGDTGADPYCAIAYGNTDADPYCANAYAETQVQIRTAPLHMHRHRCRSVLRHCICRDTGRFLLGSASATDVHHCQESSD